MAGVVSGPSLTPPQVAPVHRPSFFEPHRIVDVGHGTPEQRVAMRMRLLHGANFNDPQYFAYPSYYRMRAT